MLRFWQLGRNEGTQCLKQEKNLKDWPAINQVRGTQGGLQFRSGISHLADSTFM